MTRTLVLRPQTELEILEAAEWYQAQGPGLSADFVRAVDAVIAAIERNPRQFPRIHGRARRAPLRRFPYSVIYTFDDKEIVIAACMHVRRDPKRWQDRL